MNLHVSYYHHMNLHVVIRQNQLTLQLTAFLVRVVSTAMHSRILAAAAVLSCLQTGDAFGVSPLMPRAATRARALTLRNARPLVQVLEPIPVFNAGSIRLME